MAAAQLELERPRSLSERGLIVIELFSGISGWRAAHARLGIAVVALASMSCNDCVVTMIFVNMSRAVVGKSVVKLAVASNTLVVTAGTAVVASMVDALVIFVSF